ncbi:hypothetical protein HZA86_01045 [Candidatus Uhrbacteria bacterium]|nr:hypothetical protein [Candidatus Uhrbacteria bacterium]
MQMGLFEDQGVPSIVGNQVSKRSPYQRTLFLLLGLLVILSNASLQPLPLFAATNSVSENFTATTNIDIANTTATVDIAHGQTRLTTTDAWTNTLGFFGNNQDVFFLNSDPLVGWAVTVQGEILKTTDAGIFWHVQHSAPNTPYNTELYNIFFIDANTGWAVGGVPEGPSGYMVKTTDGGATWNVVTPSGATVLQDTYFTSTQNGWAVGWAGAIYRTQDGGATWATQTSGTGETLNAVYVDPAGTKGMIVGGTGTILRTTDSGATWSARAPANATEAGLLLTGNFSGLYFLNGNRGWLFSDGGGISYTIDHGDTAFSIQSAGTLDGPDDEAAFAAYLAGATCGPISGSCVGALRTVIPNLRAGSFFSSDIGMVVGNKGAILKTTNGGAVWNVQLSATNRNLFSVAMTSATTAYVAGEGNILLKTTDGGSGSPYSWQNRDGGRMYTFRAIDFADASNGMIVGDGGSTMLKTTDGGATWGGVSTPDNAGEIANAVDLVSGTTTGWMVDSNGGIYRTTDLGDNWTRQTANVSGASIVGTPLNGVWASDANTATVVGDNGLVVNTTDAGATWTRRATDVINDNNGESVHFPVNAATGWVVGGEGLILKTSDSGATWEAPLVENIREADGVTVLNITNKYFRLVKMLNNTTGWITGDNGIILKTTDGGTTWVQQTIGFGGDLSNMVIVDADTVWITGRNDELF